MDPTLTIAVIGLLWGLLVCLVPVIVIMEIYYWRKRKNVVEKPFKEARNFSLIVGLVVTVIMFASAHGESGLVAIVMCPFIFLGFYVGGLLIGAFYAKINRTLIIKKSGQPDGQ